MRLLAKRIGLLNTDVDPVNTNLGPFALPASGLPVIKRPLFLMAGNRPMPLKPPKFDLPDISAKKFDRTGILLPNSRGFDRGDLRRRRFL